jgi:hypothetical protein
MLGRIHCGVVDKLTRLTLYPLIIIVFSHLFFECDFASQCWTALDINPLLTGCLISLVDPCCFSFISFHLDVNFCVNCSFIIYKITL